MNWTRYRKPLARVAAALVLVTAGVFLALYLARQPGGGDVRDAGAGDGDGWMFGPNRIPDEPPVRERPGPGAIDLAGAVFDAAGEPVAGAEISAEFELGPGVHSLAPGALEAPTPGDDFANLGLAIDTSAAIIATAGPDGAFVLRGLVPGRYRLRVEGPDIFSSEVRFFDVPADGVRLIVARMVTVAGRVVGLDGAPVAGARVGLVSETSGQIFADSDEAGHFSFPGLQEGMFRAFAGRGELAARVVRVDRLGAGPFEDVELLLEPGAVVTGRVVDRASGQGVAALVELAASDASGEPTRHAESRADGVFLIPGLPAGRYSAQATAPGYVADEAIDFLAGGAFSPVIELAPGGVMAGRVVDHRGVPVAGAVVSARGVDARGAWQDVGQRTQAQRLERARGHLPGAGLGAADLGLGDARFIPKGELGVLLGPIPYPPPQGAAAVRIAAALAEGEGESRGAAPAELVVQPEKLSSFVTDADGRFRITGLAQGSYRLIATHADYADAVGDKVNLGAGKERADFELVLRPGVVLVGVVENTRKEVVIGATLIAEPLAGAGRTARSSAKADADALIGASLRLQAVTGTDGRYTLGPIAVDVHVRVTAVGHGDVERAVLLGAIEQGASALERTEDFVLPVADAVIGGRVRDSVGFPVRLASVVVERVGAKADDKPGSKPGKPSDKWPDTWLRRGATDSEGAFEIASLPPGRYRVTVEHPQFPRYQTEVETGVAADIELPFGGGVEGQVRDAHTRAPLAGARISATGPGGASADAIAAEDGGFELAPLAAGTWTLSASAPAYVSANQTVAVPAGREPGAVTARDVRIELERGATLAGTVRDYQGVRVRGAEVRAGGQTTTTDEQGFFRLRDVATGAVELRAERGGLSGTLPLTLAPGDELVTLEIALPAPSQEPSEPGE